MYPNDPRTINRPSPQLPLSLGRLTHTDIETDDPLLAAQRLVIGNDYEGGNGREGQVATASRELAMSIEALERPLAELHQRLQPLLSKGAGGAGGGAPGASAQAARCDVAEMLAVQSQRLQGFHSLVLMILQRLEV